MLTKLAPYGEFGPEICFRLDGTDEMLWKASMPYVPQPDSLIGHLEGGMAVTTWYKVERVLYEFDHPVGDSVGPGGGPMPFVAENEHFGVCVYVSEVV